MRTCRIVGSWVSLALACGPSVDMDPAGGSEADASSGADVHDGDAADDGSTRLDVATPRCEPAVFDDAGLERVVRWELGITRNRALDAELLTPLSRLESTNDGIASLRGIECAHALESLLVLNDGTDGSASVVTDLAPLTELDALRFVDVSANAVARLTALPQLRTLVLVGNPVTELGGLVGSDALEMLWLDATLVTDLTPLTRLPALEYVQATGTPITSVDALAGCAELGHLDVADTAITDIDVVAELPALSFLRIDRTDVTSLAPLAGRALEVLQASQIAIDELPQRLVVETIDLSANGLVDLSPMTSWATPVQVDLRDNLVDDVAPLLDLRWTSDTGDCVYIDLAGNPLGSADALTTLQQACDTQMLEIDAGPDFHCRNAGCPPAPG